MTNYKKKIIFLIVIFFVILAGVIFYYWDRSNVTIIDAKKFGLNCIIERECGDLVGIDCDSAFDGGYFYIDKKTGELVSKCGGYCQSGCINCPPEGWDCDTY